MIKRAHWVVAVMVALAGLAAAVYGINNGKLWRWWPQAKSAAAPARTAKVAKGNLEVRFKEVGELAPKVDIPVRPPVDGEVKAVYVEEGQLVQRGQPLALIQPGKTEAEQKLYVPTEVRSPLAGTVLYRMINPGDFVNAGRDDFIRVADLSRMIARFEIGEVDVLKFREGHQATVTVDALAGQSYAGRIFFISPGTVQKKEGSWEGRGVKKFLVKVELDQSDPRLRPGMTARMEVLVDKRPGVILAPLGGVFEEMGKATAYVKAGEGVEERSLKLGLRNEEQVEVLEGLREGETILLEKPGDMAGVRRTAKAQP